MFKLGTRIYHKTGCRCGHTGQYGIVIKGPYNVPNSTWIRWESDENETHGYNSHFMLVDNLKLRIKELRDA